MTDVPDFTAARDHVRAEMVRFVRALRRAGVDVPANAGTTATRALVELGFDREAAARAGLRACLVSAPEDAETFDRQFPEFWRRLTAGLTPDGPAPREEDGPEGAMAPLDGSPAPGETPAGESDDGPEETGEPDVKAAVEAAGATVSGDGPAGDREAVEAAWYSPTGSQSAVADLGDGGPDIDAAVAELTAGVETLKGRRWHGEGEERPNVRRALRSSFGTGGTVVSMPAKARAKSAVRAVWLVDVSRSVLDTVDRPFLLGLLRRATSAWRDCRVVFFDEDSRDVSQAFAEPTARTALDALEAAAVEWGGGTRIGASLAGLRERHPDAVDHRTVVFVVSDGLEMGEVSVLERELAGLARRAAAVLWLNPLAAAPGFEPTARGMAGALPFVDGLFAFSGPGDVVELGQQLRRHGAGGRIGYEHDPRRGVP